MWFPKFWIQSSHTSNITKALSFAWTSQRNKHDIKLLELKESNSEFLKNTRKNSILLDKILFNDISMFRKSDSKEKYYMARYFFFF